MAKAPMVSREGRVGEHVGLRLIHEGRELADGWAQLICDPAPLGFGGPHLVLGEGGCKLPHYGARLAGLLATASYTTAGDTTVVDGLDRLMPNISGGRN